MKTTSTFKALIMGAAAMTLFAADAYAQANHNTTRSNRKKGGITAPQDTGDANPQEEAVGAKSGEIENLGHVTLVRAADSGGDDLTDQEEKACETCGNAGLIVAGTGVAAPVQSPGGSVAPVMDAILTGSAEKENPGCVTVEGEVDANCDGVGDAKQKTFERPPPRRPVPRQQRR